jgi:hypothetical protein
LNIADFLSDYEAMCETALARESGHLKKTKDRKYRATGSFLKGP